MRNIFSLLLFLATGPVFAGILKPSFVGADKYQSGAEVCAAANPDFSEKGGWVSVPRNYQDASQGTTAIYYHWAHDYDASKPTLVYFDGGPGQSSHWGVLDFDFGWNVLLFDQRGIACSRPADFATYRNPAFYSSENTARDAEAIRQFLGLEKWSVYGISYGTIPSTIYAHLFPEHSTALVLEGVVFSGSDDLWAAPHRRKILQGLIESLPSSQQQDLSQFAEVHHLPDEWFSLFAREYLLDNDGLAQLREKLADLKGDAGDEIADSINHELQDQSVVLMPPILAFDETIYGMLSCKELGFLQAGASPYDSLQGLTLVRPPNDSTQDYCDPLGVTSENLYQSALYPVSVTVTYFDGGTDGATDATFAIAHYKKTAVGPAQLLIMPKGGHGANLNVLDQGSARELQIFEEALQGQKISKDLLQQLKQQENIFWAFTSK